MTVTIHMCNNGILKSFRIQNIQKHIGASFPNKICLRDAKAVQFMFYLVQFWFWGAVKAWEEDGSLIKS